MTSDGEIDYYVRIDEATAAHWKSTRYVAEMRLLILTWGPAVIVVEIILGFWLTWEHNPFALALFFQACWLTWIIGDAWRRHGRIWSQARAARKALR